jgi:hypothetical protein
MSAACLRQTPASTARLATRQGFALIATTGRLRGSCEIVTVPDPPDLRASVAGCPRSTGRAERRHCALLHQEALRRSVTSSPTPGRRQECAPGLCQRGTAIRRVLPALGDQPLSGDGNAGGGERYGAAARACSGAGLAGEGARPPGGLGNVRACRRFGHRIGWIAALPVRWHWLKAAAWCRRSARRCAGRLQGAWPGCRSRSMEVGTGSGGGPLRAIAARPQGALAASRALVASASLNSTHRPTIAWQPVVLVWTRLPTSRLRTSGAAVGLFTGICQSERIGVSRTTAI